MKNIKDRHNIKGDTLMSRADFEYVIFGKGSSNMTPEEIDTAEDLDELHYLLNEYRLAYGPGWVFSYKKRRL